MTPKTLILALIVALSSAAAHAQDRRQWIGATNADNVVLLYGTPQTDDVVINFTCDRAGKSIAFAYTFEPAGARNGMRVDVELFSDGGRVRLRATGQRQEMDDAFVLAATTRADLALRRTLTEGPTLSIQVQKSVEVFKLRGSGRLVAELLAACS